MKTMISRNPSIFTTSSWNSPWSTNDLINMFENCFSKDLNTRQGNFLVDVKEEDGCVVLEADMPGMSKEDINISVDNGVLSITGKRNYEQETKQDNYYLQERYSGELCRKFSLPKGVNENSIKAVYKDGVLILKIAKNKENCSRKIDVV